MTATRFDPSERRDWHGRWGSSGSPAATAAGAHLQSMAGTIRIHDTTDVPRYERETLDPIRERYTPEQTDAVNRWVDSSDQVQSVARGTSLPYGPLSAPAAAAIADHLSAAMTPLPHDLVLLREVGSTSRMAGRGDGDVFYDEGFASTTLRPGRFAGGRPGKAVLHILAPAGTPFVWAGRAEDELLLDRRQAFVILGQPTQVRGVTHYNVVALPKGMGQ